ncbi:hypothetical protein Golob_012893 [Gossypium lobatum]|uniref:DUF4283 domain-containing protein n=1 Tax=Gossypium lobatum TaxID=34289 RepID=A0A7J8LN43_9ROSI|nr:hypothetical protein [Gossypium lobatum]
MDLENDYSLVRFSEEDDYNKVLTNGPWLIFSQYLTIRPWTPNFSTTQDEVGIQVGRFVRIAICIDLRKPLISKFRINGHLERVEYKSLPHVCFKCCLYGHGSDLCQKGCAYLPMKDDPVNMAMPEKLSSQDINRQVKEKDYGLWMLVECRQWCTGRSFGVKVNDIQGRQNGGSRFESLGGNQGGSEEVGLNMESEPAIGKEISNGKEFSNGTYKGENPKISPA